MKILQLLLLPMLAVILAACQTVDRANENDTFGVLGSRENPVKCDGPQGQRTYLNRLAGPNGEAVTYRRAGNFGVGPDGHIIDGYAIDLDGRSTSIIIFMDMYHRDYVESRVVPGFTLRGIEPRDAENGVRPAGNERTP